MAQVIEIHDFSDPALDVYARATENQLVNRADPANALFIAESPLVIGRALDAGCVPVSFLMEPQHITGKGAEILGRCDPDLPVYTASLEVLTQLTGFHLTRGMLCAMRRPPLPSVAEVCARGGARVYELNQALFETNTLGKLKMQAWIVENLRLLSGGTMAICAIPKTVEETLGVNSDDMDNISNFPRTVAGVNIAATIREAENGKVKLSVRAVPGYDATVIAERFGGGGHKGAAGCTMEMTLAQAVSAVENVMLETCP